MTSPTPDALPSACSFSGHDCQGCGGCLFNHPGEPGCPAGDGCDHRCECEHDQQDHASAGYCKQCDCPASTGHYPTDCIYLPTPMSCVLLTYTGGTFRVDDAGLITVPLTGRGGAPQALVMNPAVADAFIIALSLGTIRTGPRTLDVTETPLTSATPQVSSIAEGDNDEDSEEPHRLRVVDLDHSTLRSDLALAIQGKWGAEQCAPDADMAADAVWSVIEACDPADPAPEGMRENVAAHLRGRLRTAQRIAVCGPLNRSHDQADAAATEYDLADAVLRALDDELQRHAWETRQDRAAEQQRHKHDLAIVNADRAHLRKTWAALSACLIKQARHQDLTDEDLVDLPRAHAAHLRGHDATRREVVRLAALVEQLGRERDLAIAHDRQPYPTADAYEKACAALEKHRGRADHAEEELAGARAAIDHMAKAFSYIAGHDRQGLDHLEDAQREARGRESAVRQARAWARRARTAEAQLANNLTCGCCAHRNTPEA